MVMWAVPSGVGLLTVTPCRRGGRGRTLGCSARDTAGVALPASSAAAASWVSQPVAESTCCSRESSRYVYGVAPAAERIHRLVRAAGLGNRVASRNAAGLEMLESTQRCIVAGTRTCPSGVKSMRLRASPARFRGMEPAPACDYRDLLLVSAQASGTGIAPQVERLDTGVGTHHGARGAGGRRRQNGRVAGTVGRYCGACLGRELSHESTVQIWFGIVTGDKFRRKLGGSEVRLAGDEPVEAIR